MAILICFVTVLNAGEGVICNNVLHNRTAFEDSIKMKIKNACYIEVVFIIVYTSHQKIIRTVGKSLMLWLSELLMQHHELNSFEELKEKLTEQAKQGEMFFRMDVRPPFQDTPENWEDVLEADIYFRR